MNTKTIKTELIQALKQSEQLESSKSGDHYTSTAITKKGNMYTIYTHLSSEKAENLDGVIAFYISVIGRQYGFGNSFIKQNGEKHLTDVCKKMKYRPDGLGNTFKEDVLKEDVVTISQEGYWASPSVFKSEIPSDAYNVRYYNGHGWVWKLKKLENINGYLIRWENQHLSLNGTLGGLYYDKFATADLIEKENGEYILTNVFANSYRNLDENPSISSCTTIWEGLKLEKIREINFSSKLEKLHVTIVKKAYLATKMQ